MVTLTLLGRRPASNPDTLLVEAVFSGNTPAAAGDSDPLNLAAIADPNLLGGPFPSRAPSTPIEVLSVNLGGYDVQPTWPAAPTLSNIGLMVYLAGVQQANGAAYPEPVLAGSVLLGIHLAEVSA
jgi:hypothetical protein